MHASEQRVSIRPRGCGRNSSISARVNRAHDPCRPAAEEDPVRTGLARSRRRGPRMLSPASQTTVPEPRSLAVSPPPVSEEGRRADSVWCVGARPCLLATAAGAAAFSLSLASKWWQYSVQSRPHDSACLRRPSHRIVPFHVIPSCRMRPNLLSLVNSCTQNKKKKDSCTRHSLSPAIIVGLRRGVSPALP